MNKIIIPLILGTMILIVACSEDNIDNGNLTTPFAELNLPD